MSIIYALPIHITGDTNRRHKMLEILEMNLRLTVPLQYGK